MKNKWIVSLALLLLTVTGAIAATPPMAPTVEVNREVRLEVIDTLIAKLNAHYVFPDKAKQVELVLRQHLREGKYDRVTDGQQLAKQLFDDIDGVIHDKHMFIDVSAHPVPPDDAMPPPPQTRAEWEKQVPPAVLERVLASNLGVEKVDHLSPNIGYLEISSFGPVFLVSDKFAAAMNKVANTDGLIIDLRNNGGGGEDSVALLISYLVDGRTRLNDIWERATGITTQYWTQDKLDGKRYGGKKPVLILAGPDTKSAAESFAYQMQALKRAKVIGERTWGGANASRPYRLSEHFAIFIPSKRPINSMTHTNWEGTGVTPDVATKVNDALAAAKVLMQRQVHGDASRTTKDH
ncbi:S41 family peptidase [Janthinobacterium sp. HSC-3S05]|uniref:S41 family peptidase n=1 Tax=Janthinobacterium lividum TaxID=29581 RepID=UPI001CD8DDE5|nr:S41 family peptidase [Janthinobacterium lividum]MCA1860412.1 S41 family peptidase [Janthinobacterium lividum]